MKYSKKFVSFKNQMKGNPLFKLKLKLYINIAYKILDIDLCDLSQSTHLQIKLMDNLLALQHHTGCFCFSPFEYNHFLPRMCPNYS